MDSRVIKRKQIIQHPTRVGKELSSIENGGKDSPNIDKRPFSEAHGSRRRACSPLVELTKALDELVAADTPKLRTLVFPTNGKCCFSGTFAGSPWGILSFRNASPSFRRGYDLFLRLCVVARARGSRRPSVVSLPRAMKLYRSMVHQVRSHVRRTYRLTNAF